MARLHGRLEISSTKGSGTTVLARLQRFHLVEVSTEAAMKI
jgi:hypothetical protein